MMPLVLVTGGEGQIASAFHTHNLGADMECFNLSKSVCDITKIQDIANVLEKYQPHIVLNTAAYTAVEQAECDRQLAFNVNVLGSENLAKMCAQHNVFLLHLSTDFVFDGQEKEPYRETYIPHPLNYYGWTKWQGELAVRRFCPQHIILRVSGVFGKKGRNFVKSIIRSALENRDINVVSDQFTCPTAAADIALALSTICQRIIQTPGLWGTYHYCGQPVVSWFHFATYILNEISTLTNLIIQPPQSMATMEGHFSVDRPLRPILNCHKIKKKFGLNSSDWQKELVKLLPELIQNNECRY